MQSVKQDDVRPKAEEFTYGFDAFRPGGFLHDRRRKLFRTEMLSKDTREVVTILAVLTAFLETGYISRNITELLKSWFPVAISINQNTRTLWNKEVTVPV